jgi:hypothetical protein
MRASEAPHRSCLSLYHGIALQVVYKICLHVHSSRRLLWKAGAVQALLQLVSRDKAAVGFHRDRAAVALATLAEAAEVKAWLRVSEVVSAVGFQSFGACPASDAMSWYQMREQQYGERYSLQCKISCVTM